MDWYAIFVETGYEDDVCYIIDRVMPYLLEGIEYRLLNPKRRLIERKKGVRKKVIRKMFPGYVFLSTNQIYDFFKRTRGLPRIIKILRNREQFCEVNWQEINQILEMVDREGIVDISKGFITGQQVQIIDGPLLGKEGIIRKVDKRKCRVKVEFVVNECSFFIDLGLEDSFKRVDEYRLVDNI